MSSTTHIQAATLLEDLKSSKGTSVSWQIGKVANALLEKAKEEEPDNVSLAVLDPFKQRSGTEYVHCASYDDVRAIIGQIAAATDHGPSIG
jgi:hypothetical protein